MLSLSPQVYESMMCVCREEWVSYVGHPTPSTQICTHSVNDLTVLDFIILAAGPASIPRGSVHIVHVAAVDMSSLISGKTAPPFHMSGFTISYCK